MSVSVAAGQAYILNTEGTGQGAYSVYNDAAVTLSIAAASPTQPRKDIVVAKVQDAFFSGATNAWSLAVVTGTAAASPSEPAVPANAVKLATIDVSANDTSIVAGDITDRRPPARGALPGPWFVCTSTTRPASPWQGLPILETDTAFQRIWDGSTWKLIGNVTAQGQTAPVEFRFGSGVYTTQASGGAAVTPGLSQLLGFVAYNGDTTARPNMVVGNNRAGWPATGTTSVNVTCTTGNTGSAVANVSVRLDWIAYGYA